MDRTEALTFIELHFYAKGSTPTQDLLKLKGFKDEPFTLNDALEGRNLPLYTKPKPPTKELGLFDLGAVGKEKSLIPLDPLLLELGFTEEPEPAFILAVGRVANISDKRSLASKLKEVEVSVGQWNAWLAKPEYRKYVRNRVEQVAENFSTTAKLGLGTLIGNNDLNAIKYWHEFSGEYKPNQDEVMNLKMVVMLLMEILVKYVEPAKMPLIADELETALPVGLKGALN